MTVLDTAQTPPSPLAVVRDGRGVVTLTLNDPGRFNALGSEMLVALQQALDAVAQDPSARAVVLAAQGKAFCAGHNLKDMAAHPDQAWYQKLFAQCSRMMLSIHKLPVPVIARVQGMATAAGCQLVAQCDLAVASDNASFATSGLDPAMMGMGPVSASKKALARAGWTAQQLDLLEINEAFAVVTMAAIHDLKLDPAKVNIHGGACALGHPIGASGARIIVTLLGALRKTGGKRGVASLCIGGGEATALAVEML